jgi:putative ABC transport system permease protein
VTLRDVLFKSVTGRGVTSRQLPRRARIRGVSAREVVDREVLARDRLGTFVAVLFGTAVATSTLGLLASASPRVPDGYAALTAAVQSPAVRTPADPFPEPRPWSSAEATALAARLAAVDGVAAAIPDRVFYAQPVIAGRPVQGVRRGHGWASAAMSRDRLVAGHAPAGRREVAISRDLGLPVGSSVTVLTGTGPSAWTVSGLIRGSGLYVSEADAADLAPGIRMIGLTGDPNLSQVRAVPGVATVLDGDSLGDLEPRADARTRWIGLQVLSAMVALSAFACMFVVASTFAFSVDQQRRDIALLRAIGATPRQVRRKIRRQAAVTGGAAALAGALLGLAGAPVIGRVMVDAGFQPPSFSVRLQSWPVLAGVALGTVLSIVGAMAAARRAARVAPLEALRRAEVEVRPMTRARWITGLVLLAGGVAAGLGCAVTDDLTSLGTYSLLAAMLLVVSAAMLAPAAVPPLVRSLLWPVRGALGMVMRESALAGARRTASTAAPVLLTVAFAVFIAGNVQTSANAYAGRRAHTVPAGTVLVPDGTPGLTDAAAPSAPLLTDVYLGDTVITGAGVDRGTTVVARDLTTPDAAVLTRSLAAQLNLRPGGMMEATLADGIGARFRITGLTADGTGPAQLLLSRSIVRMHDPSAMATALPVTPDNPVRASVGTRLVDVATYAQHDADGEDRLVWIFTLLLIAVSVGYGALAVANTLVMATSRRAPDYWLLRMAGATPRQVLLSIAGESAVTVMIGAALGSAAATLALWGTAIGLREQTGTAVAVSVPWQTALVAVTVCLMLATAAGVLPARSRLTVKPA